MPHQTFATSVTVHAGALDRALRESARRLADTRFAAALFARRPEAWSSDPAVQARIGERLGWLPVVETMATETAALKRFADGIRDEGFTDVVLLGMGGSSLAPEVLRAVAQVQPGWPRFTVVDTVNPDHLRSVMVPPARTLFLLASKSGSTVEPNVLAAHFRQRLIDSGITNWGQHFVAITDPGTALETRGSTEHFRAVFRNPPDIGGRYSALSLFGLVPAALMGLDIDRLIADGRDMRAAASAEDDLLRNPALALGAMMGTGAAHGRDKLTLIVPPALEPFGLWVEQLVAESTGKQGRGVVPIAGEPLGEVSGYGDDRVLVRLRVPGAPADHDAAADALTAALLARGTPVVEIAMRHEAALGGEFMRWEIATATSAAVIGINPFDEPNVQQAKDATRDLLDQFTREGRLPATEPDAEVDHTPFTLTGAARRALGGPQVDRLLTLLQQGDYFGILAYLPETPELTAAAARFRGEVRDRTHAATMFGYGPRYLHSTGQLHKGGPNTGVFLILTAPGHDLPVPGQPFSFGILELAQALGDLASLDQTGRRAMHVHLPRPDAHTVEGLFRRLMDGGG